MARLEAIAARAADAAAGRPTAGARFHLTLAFIGNVESTREVALCAIGSGIARTTPPFTLTLDRLGCFREAKVAWLGSDTVPEPLQQAAHALSAALDTAGFHRDPQPFRMHLTLARRCRHALPAATVLPLVWPIEAMTLTASELLPGGPRYSEVARWSLAGHR